MIVTLENGKFTAQIDSLGAQLISLKDKSGTEYIWQRKEPYWTDCAPILFPVVGRPLDGVITVDGKDYPMDLHGFARENELGILSQQDDKVEFSLKSNNETLKFYPYEFQLIVTFTLDDAGVNTEMKIINTDKKEIYFGIGGHPGICWPIFEGDNPEDYALEFEEDYEVTAITCDENTVILPDSGYKIKFENGKFPIKRELFDRDAIVIERAPFNKFNYVNKNGKGVRFEFENFKSFAMWSEAAPSEAPFVCFEPWNSMGKRKGENSNLKDKKDILNLAEGKEFVCSYKICPIG